MAIVWLTSYPRSGNTWLRFLLQAYTGGGHVDSRTLNTEVPDIHRKGVVVNPDAADHVIVKTHFPWAARHPFAEQTTGFIYVLRHPKDVLLSYLSYRKLGRVLATDDPSVDRTYAMNFIQAFGDEYWVRQGMGNWPQHVSSWLARPSHPHVVLRYERLLTHPVEELEPMLPLIGQPVDRARLKAAVEACAFSSLREIEQKEKASGAAPTGSTPLFPGDAEMMQRGVMFMNEGKSGRTLDHIGPDVEEAFNKAFAPYLSSLGYGPTAAASLGG